MMAIRRLEIDLENGTCTIYGKDQGEQIRFTYSRPFESLPFDIEPHITNLTKRLWPEFQRQADKMKA